MAAQHYAFEKVIVIVGVLPVTGFHEGDDVVEDVPHLARIDER